MNKLLTIASLCALALAPGCQNLYIWNKPEKKTTVVRTSKKNPTQPKKEKKRVSGPQGWNIDMTNEQ